jgi:RHS repeat-associated protein
LYGLGRISENQGGSTEYYLGDALGSVRQLVDADGVITLAKSYAPYGEVILSAGAGQTSYGFTGETTDASGLVYLRARYYASNDGRFLSRDTWAGDMARPMSYNAWLYVHGNPVNYADPLGLYPNYIFFFTGFGNNGDANGDGKYTLADLDPSDPSLKNFLEKLQNRTGAEVIPIFPYGEGIGPIDLSIKEKWGIVVQAAYGMGIPAVKAMEVLDILREKLGISTSPCDLDLTNDFYDEALGITFLSYSTGGQIAYSTAQELAGDLHIDKLVNIASPYRAYNGGSNIGALWEIWGESDFSILGNPLESLGGFMYNLTGWETDNQSYKGRGIYNASEGGTMCMFKDVDGQPYFHNTYFSNSLSTGSVKCLGARPYQHEVSYTETRADGLLDLLVNVIGVGRP